MAMFGSQWLANPSSTYEISKSCVFNGTNAYMSRTPGSAGNQKTSTQSMWVKRAKLSTDQTVGINTANGLGLWFNANDTMTWYCHYDSGWEGKLTTTQVFRDPGAWYHIVTMVDTTQAVAANRAKVYVNGTQVTAFSTEDYPDQNDDTAFNAAAAHSINIWLSTPSYYFNGYIAEHHWIDGTALTPSSFGETNDEGVWVPKKYSGSYGTTGFYLDFADSSDLGDDESGQGNDWAESNLDAADQRTDTPTNNQVTFNPLNNQRTGGTLTEGNTVYSGPSTRTMVSLTANLPPTGKWAVAFSADTISTDNGWNLGITKSNNSNFGDAVGSNEDVGASDGINMNPSGSEAFLYDYINSSSIDPSQAITTSDEFWLAVDMATGKCFLGIYDASATAMVWIAADSGVDGNPADGSNPSVTISAMIGSTDYTFAAAAKAPVLTLIRSADLDGTIPTGYTYFQNISDFPAPALKDGSTNFQTALFTGTGSSRSVVNDGNSDMQPDIIWIAGRSSAYNKGIFDAARGTQKELQSNSTAAETTLTAGISSFDSDGFSFNGTNYNTNTYTFVAWQWSAGNSGASNENGTINTTTTYSDSTAGVSVSTYTGTGSAATIGHGLGVAPKLIMVKNRSATDAWKVYHSGVASDPQTDYLVLNTDAAIVDDSTVWNDTAPTSTVFSIGTHTDVNTSTETYVAYAFAEVAGFSSFGSYVGNGQVDAPFSYTGFRPAVVITKPSSRADGWVIWDTKRDTYNLTAQFLTLETSNIEYTGTNRILDILSNGFKIKSGHDSVNNSGDTYVYIAFAENPFGGDGASPATAR